MQKPLGKLAVDSAGTAPIVLSIKLLSELDTGVLVVVLIPLCRCQHSRLHLTLVSELMFRISILKFLLLT